jgi:outer membrane receptor protein involved in Fe transport
MRQFFTSSLALLLSFTTYNLTAHPITISGKVTDTSGHALAYANIMMFGAKDTTTLLKADYSNDDGNYKLSLNDTGSYFVRVSMAGYGSYISNVFHAVGDIILPPIKIKQSNNELKEVSISAQKPLIEVHPDKLVVNVENSIINAGSSAMDVLSRSPGVSVDQNDNISLKGKQGVTIMMDGKTVPISGTDLANLLKSMPSSSIASIELISNPSAKYDAAGSAGIINIITKRDRNIGFNATLNGSYAQGVYPKTNDGLNLNYRNKNFNLYANYTYVYREGFNELQLNRSFYTDGVFTGGYHQNYNTIYPIRTHVAGVGMDYSVSKNTTVGFAANGYDNHFDSHGYDATIVKGMDDEDSSLFNTTNKAQNIYYNYALNLNMKHTFDSAGTSLTADADYARYWNNTYQHFNTYYYNLEGVATLPPYLLYGDITGLTQIRSFKMDYTHPLKHNLRIDAGLKVSYVTEDNEPLYYDQSNGGNILDTTKSDHFIYTENINAAYVNLSKDWKKWSTQLGLRVEQTIVTGDEKITDSTFIRSYIQPFPSLAVQYHADDNDDVGLTLSRRIDRPTYQQLNPFKYFLDPTNYKEGNPYLDPALSYNVELSYTYKQHFITSFTYSYTNNVITEVIQPLNNEDKVSIQTDQNLTSNIFYDITGAYTMQFYKWWSNVTNFDVFYSIYKGDLANTNLNNGKPAGDINIQNSFLLSKSWSAELGGMYQTPQLYGYMNLTSAWMVNAGLQKKLFDGKATIRLNATDIFWHGSVNGTSSYTAYIEHFNVKRDTRQISIAFTYRFGNSKLGQVQHHNGGDEDEKKRAASTTS